MSANARYHLVELHRRHRGWQELQDLAVAARELADQLRAEGLPLRYLRTISVPDEDACFHLFEGTDSAIAEASSRAPNAYRGER